MISEDKAILDSAVGRITSVLSTLNEIKDVTDAFYDGITRLYDELYNMNKVLAEHLRLDVDNLLNDMANIASLRDIFVDVSAQFEKVEPTLCDLVDVLDKDDGHLDDNTMHMDTATVAQLIKECNEVTVNNKSMMKSIKDIVGTYLDFNEISENHLKTLDDIVKESLNQLFEIYEERNGSPIRHFPSFTLDKIVWLLSRDTSHDNLRDAKGRRVHSNQPHIEEEPKFPTFSESDMRIANKFLQLQRKIIPIDKSLIEILPQRMQLFDSRTFKYTDNLLVILNKKYDEVMINYNYLSKELRALKLELMDNRWNLIFDNLNRELSNRILYVRRNYEDLKSCKFSTLVQDKQKKKLDQDTRIISKTFNTIYKALEFSLLRTDIASETNNLAEEWIALRELTDEYMEGTPSLTEDNVLQIVNDNRLAAEAASNTKFASELDLFKPPQLPRFDSRDENTTDEELESGNLTIESIANNLRQFSLASSTKKHETQKPSSMRKMTKPLIIPSITSSTSATTVSSDVLEGLNDNELDDIDASIDSAKTHSRKPRHDTMAATIKSNVTLNALEEPRGLEQGILLDSFHDNNSDFESDQESSRIEQPVKTLTRTRMQAEQRSTSTEYRPSILSRESRTPSLPKAVDPQRARILENEKMRYYANKQSLIPRVCPQRQTNGEIALLPPLTTTVPHTPPKFVYRRTQLPDGSYNETLRESGRRRLRQPTLMSQLLTPIARR